MIESSFKILSKSTLVRAKRIRYSVQANTETTIETLKGWGACTEFQMNRGGHFDNIEERVRKGFFALADFYKA